MSVNFAQALENLYGAIEAKLIGLTPNAYAEHAFARRRPDNEELQPLAQMPGRPRLFEIAERECKVVRHLYTGTGYSGIEVQVPVEIMYPTHDREDVASWQAAAFSDWFQFSSTLLDSSTITADGVQAHMAWDGPEIVQSQDDPWFVLRIRVVALLHVLQ